MKVLLTLTLSSLFSVAALAMPNVGDYAVYEINANGMQITQKIELTAYNASSGKFTQVETTTFQGQQQQQTTMVNGADLPTEELVEQILMLCENPQVGGVLETISVPAGSFNSCALTDAQSGMRLNYANVPFGFVKLDGPGLSMRLLQYKK